MPEFDFQNAQFTEEEWRNCLKVLNSLKDNPTDNPDNLTFKTLISKIKKNARTKNRKENYLRKKEADRAILNSTEISKKALDNRTNYQANQQEEIHTFTELNIAKNCYSCNKSYQKAHFFYNRLCPECAIENYKRRFDTINLSGRKVILTGGRVKVGYAAALKFLRAGAELVVTTRFPAIAYSNYKKEKDFEEWKGRLFCYGLDLRDLREVERFVEFYKRKYETLDILVNNAAQTIKYPPNYYLPIVARENNLLKQGIKNNKLIANSVGIENDVKFLNSTNISYGKLEMNRFNQPKDKRDKTSWNSTLTEIPLTELLEVNLINQISPYLLIKSLYSCFLASKFNERFIINVSSSEGQFSYTGKTMFHPHTNMTKAALNMMTLTSAKDFANSNIYMNSVDVGWISTGATENLRQKQFEEGYIPPLDPVDGGARILQPIIDVLSGEMKMYTGKLLKNYRITEW